MFVPGVVWFFSLSASLGLLANLPYFILNHQNLNNPRHFLTI